MKKRKTIKLVFDTSAGTGKCVCKYGAISRDVVVALLGDGVDRAVYLPGAGHHSTQSVWTVEDPVTAGLLRRLCRDAALRSAAFTQRNRLFQLHLDKRWPMHWGKAVVQKGLNSQCHGK